MRPRHWPSGCWRVGSQWHNNPACRQSEPLAQRTLCRVRQLRGADRQRYASLPRHRRGAVSVRRHLRSRHGHQRDHARQHRQRQQPGEWPQLQPADQRGWTFRSVRISGDEARLRRHQRRHRHLPSRPPTTRTRRSCIVGHRGEPAGGVRLLAGRRQADARRRTENACIHSRQRPSPSAPTPASSRPVHRM